MGLLCMQHAGEGHRELGCAEGDWAAMVRARLELLSCRQGSQLLGVCRKGHVRAMWVDSQSVQQLGCDENGMQGGHVKRASE